MNFIDKIGFVEKVNSHSIFRSELKNNEIQ